MNRSIKNLVTSITCCALLTLIIGIIFYLQKPRPIPEQPTTIHNTKLTSTQESITGVTIKNVVLKEFEKNKIYEIIVNAQECKFSPTNNLIECLQVTCTLLNRKKEAAYIQTDTATIDKATQNIFFGGNVTGQYNDLFINTSDIIYNYNNQQLITKKQASYFHPLFNISAQQSSIDIKKNRIELTGNVINEFLYRSTGNNR